MIAIIGAFKEEIEGLKVLLSDAKRDDRFEGISTGRIHGREVVLCVCGIGKVFAAAATAYVLSKYNPSEIINIGVAGGVGQSVGKLDVVVADRTIQSDFDLTAGGLKMGQLFEGHSGHFDSDKRIATRLHDLAKAACAEEGVGHKNGNRSVAHRGVIATADRFVASAEDSLHLRQAFDALACDMESAAIAQVAEMFDVRFASMRSISDGADCGAAGDFDAFAKRAAEISIAILSEYLK